MHGYKGTWGDEEDDEKREPFMWWGVVSNNQDPEKRGRCRIFIPGMNHTESALAEPFGSPGFGGGKHGVWAVPKKGATVLVGFILGDIDSPFFIPGPAPVSGAADLSYPVLPPGLATVFMLTPPNPGLIKAGNIDLTKRPNVKNSDGSISTVRSMSFEENGIEILVPTVSSDGTKILSDTAAIAQYHNAGKFLGKFDTPTHATEYAQRLHNQQAAALNTQPINIPADPEDIILETDDFRFSLVQKEGAKRARLETLLPTVAADKQDQVRSIIEININEGANGKSHVVNIIAPSGINIQSQGTIAIDGGVVTIKGRTVSPSTEAI
jgi:hypothetical protein